MKIPFVDLKEQYITLKKDIDGAIARVIDETAFIAGPHARSFEAAFAAKLGVKHCIGVGNGTDAIYIVMKCLGIGAGDEVITVANSWISSSETITQTGATPVFVDVDDYYTIDVDQIEKKITPKTKAIIPVHIYGQPADISRIQEICERRKLILIEDCAQSHLTTAGGQIVGTFGIASTFSFYPGKNLGAYGDAGCIVTNDDKLAEKMRMFGNHGALKKHHHLIEGINSRLDGIQAAILQAKLPHLPEWNERRRKNAALYTTLLADEKNIELPKIRPSAGHTFHLYVIKTEKRDELKQFLEQRGIETAIHYPTALPLLPCYSLLGFQPSDFPRAAANQSRILSLPMFPELTKAQIETVVTGIRDFFRGQKA